MSSPLPTTFTHLVGSGDEITHHDFPGFAWHETVASRGAFLKFELSGTVKLQWPSTWTNEEARAELMTMLSKTARVRCFAIIAALPDDVVPILVPQLEEIAEYETNIATLRARSQGPDILENLVLLPVGR